MLRTPVILSVAMFLFLVQCTMDPASTNPEQNTEQGQMLFKLNMADAPAEVAGLSGRLSRSDQDTIYFDFELKDGSAYAQVEDLAAGYWKLEVDAFNADGTVIYNGSTSVNVQPGVITQVHLNLNPTTGSLEIVVTWGENPDGIFLSFAQNQESEWRILLMDINGNRFEDLCRGKYPTWIDPQKQKFVFRRGTKELWQYDLQTRTASFISYLDYSINFLKYSVPLNKLLCDYYDGSNYNLGYMNLDGSDFTTILADSFSEKYPVSPVQDDWIYYHSNAAGPRQIFRIKADGNQNEQIVFDTAACEFPAFSYNGKKMVYTKYIPGQTASIVVKDIKSGREIEVSLLDYGRPIYPAFSKNGKEIVFPLITGEDTTKRQLYKISVDGAGLTQITMDTNYSYYTRPMFW